MGLHTTPHDGPCTPAGSNHLRRNESRPVACRGALFLTSVGKYTLRHIPVFLYLHAVSCALHLTAYNLIDRGAGFLGFPLKPRKRGISHRG